MGNYLYTCKHCYKEFRPARRGVQKFCCDSCRVSHHQCIIRLQQKKADALAEMNQLNTGVEKSRKKGKKKGKKKSEGMSISGIGDAAVGIAIVDTLKSLFTAEHNKPATKGDLLKLVNHLSRYQLIKSLEPNIFGQKPYLDLETGIVIYR